MQTSLLLVVVLLYSSKCAFTLLPIMLLMLPSFATSGGGEFGTSLL